jgi:hypothetical protein
MWRGLAAAAALALGAVPAQAAQLCAWMIETTPEEDYHEFALWLEADQDLSIFYKMAGQGVFGDGNSAHSPGSGTFVLHKGEKDRPWGFGTTVYAPAEVDIVAEIREYPKDVFDEEPPPLITQFAFRRMIPEGETAPPPVLAERQCKTVDVPPR